MSRTRPNEAAVRTRFLIVSVACRRAGAKLAFDTFHCEILWGDYPIGSILSPRRVSELDCISHLCLIPSVAESARGWMCADGDQSPSHF